VYGTPQHLHGGKDDSELVTCRIKQGGLTPGDKVHITSTVFGLSRVLPIRQMTMSFPTPTDVLYDLQLSYDIDRPLSFFNGFRFPTFQLPPFPIFQLPESCDDLSYGLGLIDSTFGWQVWKNHPWLGATWFDGGTIHFQSKKRYNQTFGLIFIADYGDGVAGSFNYMYARHVMTMPTKWAVQFEFDVPSYSMVQQDHMAPFPDFQANIWWGSGDLDYYPQIWLEVMGQKIMYCENGRNYVAANGYNASVSVSQNTRWHFEINSNNEIRGWAHGGVRPTSPSAGLGSLGGILNNPVPSDGLTGASIYAVTAGTSGGKSANPGVVSGSPTDPNTTIRDNFLNFTTGPTVSGNTSGYHEPLQDGYIVDLAVRNFQFVTLPDDFNFTTQVPPDCTFLQPTPPAGTRVCESLDKSSDTEYITSQLFLTGTTEVDLEGVEQRRGIDYVEDVDTHTITFVNPVLSSAKLYVCYIVGGAT
jgi:hypothetical protein